MMVSILRLFLDRKIINLIFMHVFLNLNRIIIESDITNVTVTTN